MSQEKQILEHLKSNKTLTAIEALNMFGCFRLSARILDLKQKGHVIKNVSNDSKFAVYKMVGV